MDLLLLMKFDALYADNVVAADSSIVCCVPTS
jgi:hypothetical protein